MDSQSDVWWMGNSPQGRSRRTPLLSFLFFTSSNSMILLPFARFSSGIVLPAPVWSKFSCHKTWPIHSLLSLMCYISFGVSSTLRRTSWSLSLSVHLTSILLQIHFLKAAAIRYLASKCQRFWHVHMSTFWTARNIRTWHFLFSWSYGCHIVYFTIHSICLTPPFHFFDYIVSVWTTVPVLCLLPFSIRCSTSYMYVQIMYMYRLYTFSFHPQT